MQFGMHEDGSTLVVQQVEQAGLDIIDVTVGTIG